MNKNLTLPLPAEAFIPHRPPMRLVERLISFDNAGGVVEAAVAADCILVSTDGALDEAGFVELLAQSYAVVKGYDDTLNGKKISAGYLVGVRKLRITGRARAGEHLLIRVRTIGSFEGFAVVEGEIVNGSETIATGTIKLWIITGGDAT